MDRVTMLVVTAEMLADELAEGLCSDQLTSTDAAYAIAHIANIVRDQLADLTADEPRELVRRVSDAATRAYELADITC